MVVLGDADLERAAEAAVRDCFSNCAAQLCISMERIYVVESAYDGFLDRFLDLVRAMRLGGDLDFGPDMGSLISATQLDRVSGHVQRRRRQGRDRACRWPARPDVGPYFYEPTVPRGRDRGHGRCAGPRPSAPSCRSARCATRPRRSAWPTTRPTARTPRSGPATCDRGRPVAARIETGTVSINETYAAVWGATRSPMGGVKDSGLGRRHGRDGILKYTEPQTVAVQRLAGFAPPRGSVGRVGTRLHRVAQGAAEASAAGDRRLAEGARLRRRGRRVGVRRVGRGALRLVEKGYRVLVLEAGRGSRTTSSPRPRGTCGAGCGRRGWAASGSSAIHRLPDVHRARRCRCRRRVAGLRQHALPARTRRSTTTRSGATSPTGGPSSRRRTTWRAGCSASPRTRRRPRPTSRCKAVADQLGVGHTFTLTPVGVFFGTQAGRATVDRPVLRRRRPEPHRLHRVRRSA